MSQIFSLQKPLVRASIPDEFSAVALLLKEFLLLSKEFLLLASPWKSGPFRAASSGAKTMGFSPRGRILP